MQALIDDALNPTPQTATRLESNARKLSTLNSPSVLSPTDERNPITADKKAMESLFAALEERGVHQPKKLTEFEVYARLDEYAKQAKKT